MLPAEPLRSHQLYLVMASLVSVAGAGADADDAGFRVGGADEVDAAGCGVDVDAAGFGVAVDDAGFGVAVDDAGFGVGVGGAGLGVGGAAGVEVGGGGEAAAAY
mmetsp:Transcript_27915/g.42548  ORF Transcript_27915/g.42548 Transcript_27915/m.42548 type:complete len:104 (-) Transcript_27915:312-623(-)